ncbi:3-oxoacyl-ACP synthase III family protein [Nocardiopsis salina]|uniref:3-oxoacyl-ACP synthase III family protein n=1 Tax=Nocardiopsis salina TaxID=245836 RepID=UPI00034A0C09|nr:ketoacyl-ACP synthase III [Nocardiopsis salina]
MPTGILQLGSYIPDTAIDNEDIAKWTGASPDWVTERTGVRTRYYADAKTPTSELAEKAVRDLLADDPYTAEQIDLIVVSTCTPDQPQPATASHLQRRLGLGPTAGFDINSVCTGFLCGLTSAKGILETNGGTTAVVVGADKFSSIMDRSDKKTVSLFGDGAGAVLIGKVPEGYGIHSTVLIGDGDTADFVGVDAGGTSLPNTPEALEQGRDKLQMQGPQVKDWAMTNVPKLVDEALQKNGWTTDDVDRVIFHQANVKMLDKLLELIGIDRSKAPMTAPDFGNTAGASIPLTLHQSHIERPLQRGERILLAAVGGGMTAGAMTMTWY